MSLMRDDQTVPIEDVISADFLETYHREYDVIYEQLVYIKNNLFVLGRIVTFPFDLFEQPHGTPFWSLVSKALFDSTITALYTLVAEGGNDFALSAFRARVVKIYLRKDLGNDLLRQLNGLFDEVNFDRRISQLREQIKKIRNSHIAHLDREVKMNIANSVQYQMPLEDLLKTLDIAYELFLVLSFHVYPTLDFWSYHAGLVGKFETDIDEILTLVASNTFYLKRFREDFELKDQQEEMEKLSKEQREILETWRVRVDKLLD